MELEWVAYNILSWEAVKFRPPSSLLSLFYPIVLLGDINLSFFQLAICTRGGVRVPTS